MQWCGDWRVQRIFVDCNWKIVCWKSFSLQNSIPLLPFRFSYSECKPKWSLVFNLPLTYYRVKDVRVTVSFRKFTAKFHEFSISNSEATIFTIVLFLIRFEENEMIQTRSDWSKNRIFFHHTQSYGKVFFNVNFNCVWTRKMICSG